MKIAIISDTHLGDDKCALATMKDNTIVEGSKYQDFLRAAGTGNDYLILAGDVLDFSIASYEKAYEYGRFFFQKLKDDKVANEVIYMAGNHDADIWYIVQGQRSVINKIQSGKPAETYDHSMPGIIDDRANTATKGFSLPKVSAQSGADGPKYGGLFLDKITKPDTVFNFVYPNLYIVTDNESVLVTHGHFLEQYWSLAGETANTIAYDDLKIGEVDIEEMMEMNYPLNQLACTGIGQAGVLTKVVRQVELDVKNGDLQRVRKYLDRLEKEIDDMTDYGWLKELVVDYIVKKAKEEILDSIGKTEQTRYSEEFIHKKDVRERFKRFYNSSLLEIGDMNTKSNFNIPAPWRVIFGHTHQPIAWDDPNPPKFDAVSSASPKRLTMHNTGGWLFDNGKFCGADVFTYETGKGFASTLIS